MKKVTLFGSFLIVCCSLLLISCPFSVSSNSDSRSTLNLQFNIPSQMQSESRAILGPGGFLYIRTLGGPVGDSGPAYGPYTLSGGEVTINDIPAGSYSSMVFLHSTFNLAGKTLTVNGKSMTVEEALTLSDAEYTQYILGASNTEAFYALIDGLGSQGKTGPIVIRPGTNQIAVTLIPLCSPQSTVTMNMTNSVYNGNYKTDVSRFIQLEFNELPTTWETLRLNVSSQDAQDPFVLYSSSGAKVSNFSFNSELNAFTGSVQTSALPLYLYLGTLSETIAFSVAEDISNTVINIAAISGVTAPVVGGTPVTAITETEQYTGTVTWSDSPTTFAPDAVYTATITLTAKAGFTLTGVAANSFTIEGATATNDVNSGLITAVFPATGAAPDTVINIVAIPGVTAPVVGGTPVTAITETEQYTGTVTWSDSPTTFAPEAVYTATITLTAKAGFTLTGVAANSFTIAGATAKNAINSGVMTAVFPATGAAPDTVINIVAIPGVTAPVVGGTPVTAITETEQYTGTVTWSDSPTTFAPDAVYTATITLTAKAGFTLTGVAANSFTIAGATAKNAINSGVVTALFPTTGAPKIVVLSYGYPVTSEYTVSMRANGKAIEKEVTITIKNNGNAPLIITNTISGEGKNRFTITPARATIPPFGTMNFILIFFDPKRLPHTAQLTISSNDPEKSEFCLTLDGYYS